MAVSISGTSSPTWTNGQSRTITGTGFGTKATAAPQIWDTFSGGTNGATIGGKAPTQTTLSGGSFTWGTTAAGGILTPVYSNALTRGGRTLSALSPMDTAQWNCSLSYSNAQTEWYGSWWVYYNHYAGSVSRNTKPIEHYGGAGDCAIVYSGWGDVSDSSHRTNMIDSCNGWTDPSPSYGGPNTPTFYEQWMKLEFYLKQSSSSNGAFKVWVTQASTGRVLQLNRDPAKTNNGQQITQWTMLGAYCDSSPADRKYRIYGSDFYIDNTQARVMLGNANTLAASTILEHQIPSAWTDTSITVSVNKAGLSDGTVYLYVFDSAGLVNSTGYAVTIGTGGTVIAPVASFNASAVTGQAPLSVTFTDTSSNTPTLWVWDFDTSANNYTTPDTAATQGPHAVTYDYGGAFNARLTVTNSAGSDVEDKALSVRYLKPTNFGAN